SRTLGFAIGTFQPLAGRAMSINLLTHAGGGRSAGVDRDRHLNTDGVGDLRLIRRRTRYTSFITADLVARVILISTAGHQIDGWQVSRPRHAHILLGNVGR